MKHDRKIRGELTHPHGGLTPYSPGGAAQARFPEQYGVAGGGHRGAGLLILTGGWLVPTTAQCNMGSGGFLGRGGRHRRRGNFSREPGWNQIMEEIQEDRSTAATLSAGHRG